MAANIGNLAILISGNAKPFQNTLANVKNTINQFSAGTQNWITINPPRDASQHLAWGSFGRLIRSALVAGFGGGIAGAMVGVAAMAFGQVLEKGLEVVGEIGHKLGAFLADSFEEGMKLSRMTLGVNFLAGNQGRGGEWMKELRDLSATSGFTMEQLGSGMRLLAGNSDDLDNVIPRLRAIAKIGAGIGLDAENVRMFALAVGQVTAAGRFEAQELNQLTEHGLPIKELAKTAGMGVGEFRQAVKDGAVDVNVLDKTLNRLALEPTGRFFGILSERAGTALGQIDKITTSWNLFKATLGMGVMQGLKDTGWLDAIQNGLGWIGAHQGEIKDALNSILRGMKEFAVFSATGLGLLTDIWADYFNVITAGARGTLEALRAMAMVDVGLGEMLGLDKRRDINIQAVKAYDELLNLLEKSRLQPGQNRARDWGLAVGQAFAQPFGQVVQDELRKIEIFPTLTSQAQQLQATLRSSIRDGLTPLDKFEKTMDLLKEIKNFEADRPLRDMQLEWKNAGLGEGGFGGLGGAGAILANRLKAGGLVDIGAAQAFQELEKNFSKAFDQFPRALERGSVDAASAITHAMYGSSQMNVQERIAKIMDLAKTAAQQTAENTKNIAAGIAAWQGNQVKP